MTDDEYPSTTAVGRSCYLVPCDASIYWSQAISHGHLPEAYYGNWQASAQPQELPQSLPWSHY